MSASESPFWLVPWDSDRCCIFFNKRCLRASVSLESSCVLKARHVLLTNAQNSTPIHTVKSSSISRVWSVCRRSLAKPCQWAQINNNRKIARLWGSGKRPSKAGMIHYVIVSGVPSKRQREACTWRMSSKSRVANFFSWETLFEKRLIVSLPKLGICRNLHIDVSPK